MIHPHARLQLIDEVIGYGLFATRFIPAGTITYVKDVLEIELHLDHEALSTPAYANYIKKYAYREASGNHVIGWDLSKYMNHSCNPNTLSTGYGFEIAISDIKAGEEITDDYGMLNIDHPMPCACKQAGCRHQVQPDDMDYLHQQWDEKVINALDIMPDVSQPLMELLDTDTRRSVLHYLNSGKNYKSVKTLQYRPQLGQTGSQ